MWDSGLLHYLRVQDEEDLVGHSKPTFLSRKSPYSRRLWVAFGHYECTLTERS